MQDEECTPPHLPTYSVNLSNPQIEAILLATFEDITIQSIRQLQRGQSFNNRIYFITADVHDAQQEFVLKVSGQFFDGRKVENEVACQLMLKHYCPNVPIPRVFAWSTDGTTCEIGPETEALDGQIQVRATTTRISGGLEQSRSWILMQKLPGKRMDISDSVVHEPEYLALMKQLAGYTHAWRSKFPRRQGFGNIRMRKQPSSMEHRSLFHFEAAGLIMCDHLDQDCVISTRIDYFLQRLENAMKALDASSYFPATHRQRVKIIVGDNLLYKHLHNMRVLKSESHQYPVFTHYDFAPRNMLVDHDPITNALKVTGILDFEFAGFFPVEEEFINDTIGNEGDWPSNLYQVYLDELERLGCEVPQISCNYRAQVNDVLWQNGGTRNIFPEQLWATAALVAKVVDDVSPWQIVAGTYHSEKLDRELSQAAARLEDSITKILERC